MTNKSNVDVAFDIVSTSSSPIHFADLWAKVMEIQGIDAATADEKVGSFYTQLLLDGRFINLGDNTWDLRTRYTFEKATLNTNECYTDEDDDEIDPEESEDEDSEEKDNLDEDEDSEESSEESKSDYEGE